MLRVFSNAFVAIVVSCANPTAVSAQEIPLTSEGTVEFFDHTGNLAEGLLDGELPEQLRSGLRLYWDSYDAPWLRVAVKNHDEASMIAPLEEEVWARLGLTMQLSATRDRIDFSDGILLNVYVENQVTQFWGEETITVDSLDVEWTSKTSPFRLKLHQTDPPETTYKQLVRWSSRGAVLTSWEEPMQDSVRLFKIRSQRKYLDLVAIVLGHYLKDGQPLDVEQVGFLQEVLPRHPHFTRMTPEEQARQLHQFALKLREQGEQTTIAGTNDVSRNNVALTLLNNLPLEALRNPPEGDPLSEGTPLPKSFQKAVALEMDIICDIDRFECMRRMGQYSALDRIHPFAAQEMWIMLGGYLDALDAYSKENAPQNEDAFVLFLMDDPGLVADWTLIKCVLDRDDGARAVDLNRRMRGGRPNQFRWMTRVSAVGEGCGNNV